MRRHFSQISYPIRQYILPWSTFGFVSRETKRSDPRRVLTWPKGWETAKALGPYAEAPRKKSYDAGWKYSFQSERSSRSSARVDSIAKPSNRAAAVAENISFVCLRDLHHRP